jgi:dihydrofolate reductase
MNKNLSIIVASSLEYGIGFENKLCWNIPEELKHFRHITSSCLIKDTKNCVIMGKNTWYSIPNAPLKNRINIIISSNEYDKIKKETLEMPDVRVFKTIDDALIYVDSDAIIGSCFIIGGAKLYNTILEKYIKYITSIYWSIIYDKKYECDCFIASNLIYNNFNFNKEDIVINDKYVSMYGTNKNRLNMVVDEDPD